MSDEPPVVEEELSPYIIEGARSSRSRCKTCRRKIDKGVLRIGILIEGPYGTGYMWHHIKCAARRQFDRVVEAYEIEAWKAAKEPPKSVPDLDELQRHREKAEEERKQRKTIPYSEPSPTGRARCKHCGESLEQGKLRIVLGRGVYFGNQVRVGPINIHPACVARALQAEDCATEAEGFEAALRSNSIDVPTDQLDAVLAEIGDLS